MALDKNIVIETLPSERLESEKLRRLLQYWLDLRGASRMPDRAAFSSPEQLGFILGQITLVDVQREPLNFYFRLVGTKIEEAGRRGDQGKTLDAVEPASYRETLELIYRETTEAAEPGLKRIRLLREADEVWYEQVVLPFTRDGDRVDMLLSGTDWPPEMEYGLLKFDRNGLGIASDRIGS